MSSSDAHNTHSDVPPEAEPEFVEVSRMRLLYKTFPLLDSLEVNYPTAIVNGLNVIETVQFFALLFNNTFPWGPVIRGISIPIYFTILPFWDSGYLIDVNYSVYGPLFWVLFAALIVLLACFIYHLAFPRSLRKPVMRFTQVLLYVLIGPLFLPSVHALLAMSVCNKGTPKSLAAFPARQCFSSSDVLALVQSVVTIIAMVLLVVPKVVVTMLVYDDHPLSRSPRARTHGVVEGWMLVFQITSTVLYHYLPAVGQRETFTALLTAGLFLLCVTHAFYLPFIHQSANRLRVVGLGCLSYCGLVMTLVLTLGSSTPLYSARDNWDVLVIAAGVVLVGVLCYRGADFRISAAFRHDLARAAHGDVRMTRFSTRMKFPHYLPAEERTNLSEKDALSAYLTSGQASIMKQSSHSINTINSSGTDANWKEDAHIEELEDFTLASYIDSIYVATDVELSTRFLGKFSQETSNQPSKYACGFAFRIYAKGLTRFTRDEWLQLQFATFLLSFTSRLNPAGLALCEDLNRRELSPMIAFRLHHRINSINASYMRHRREVKKTLTQAHALHKDTLVNIRNFWKQLSQGQISVSQLSLVATVIMDGIYHGMSSYSRAISEHQEVSTVTQYAQFLEHVTLDLDSAAVTREFAVEMVVRQETGLKAGGATSIPAMNRSKKKQKVKNQYRKHSRRLRASLTALLVIIFLLLVGFLIAIIVVHSKDVTSAERIKMAVRSRLYAVRSLWTAYVAMGSSDTSSSWLRLREELAKLRNANKAITYGDQKSFHWRVVATMKMPLFTSFYDDAGSHEELGVWRSGEVFISTLETLVPSQTTSDSRDGAYAVLKNNELSGATAAFNASLNAFTDEADDNLFNGEYVVIALFLATLLCICLCFFVFRYFLAGISGARLSALELFRLIPQSALQSMVAKMSTRIDHFDAPDEVFETMLIERGYKKDSAVTRIPEEGRDATGGTAQAAMSMSSLMNSLAGTSAAANSFRDLTTTVEEAAPGGKFALLSKNSTVADLGRLKFVQGQYEAPYQKDAFMPPQMGPEELKEYQRQIDDVEVEESLIKYRAKVAAIKDAEIQQEDDHRLDDLLSASTRAQLIYRILSVALPALCLAVAVVAAVLCIRRLPALNSLAESQISFMQMMQEGMFTFTDMLDAVEAVAFDATGENIEIMLDALSNSTTMEVKMCRFVDLFESTALMGSFSMFQSVYKQVFSQAMAAAALGCYGITTLDCSSLSSVTWTRELFLPTAVERLIFNPLIALPQGKETDMAEPPATMITLAKNIIASPYYTYLKGTMRDHYMTSKRTIQTEEFARIQNGVQKDLPAKRAILSMTVILLVATVMNYLEVRLIRKARRVVSLITFICLVLAPAAFAVAIVLTSRPLPQDGPYTDTVARYRVVENIYLATYGAREDVKLAAFAAIPFGAVDFEEKGFVEVDLTWVQLFNIMGADYLNQLTAAYTCQETCTFLDAIVVTLGCKYNNFNPAICSLPRISQFDWNITDETFGYRLGLQYANTQQLLYSNRNDDMNVLTSAQQIALSKSLAFGPLRRSSYDEWRNILLDTLTSYTSYQETFMMNQHTIQRALTIALTVLAFIVAFLDMCIIFGVAMELMDEHHVRSGAKSSNTTLNKEEYTDKSFRRLVRCTLMVLLIFTIVVFSFFLLLLISYDISRNKANLMGVVTLRNVQLLQSAINLQNSKRSPWLKDAALMFAYDSVATSERFYRSSNLHFSTEVSSATFGSSTITFNRYDERAAVDTSAAGFELHQSLLAFGGLIDPSQRRWRQRSLEMVSMMESMRIEQESALNSQLFNLSSLMEEVCGGMVASTIAENNRRFAVFLAIFCVTFVVYLVLVWYLIFFATSRLMKEEEGTQVMLRMIPLHIRRSIPAIDEYLSSGRTIQDSNVLEIDIAAREYNILPTVITDSHGVIRHFCKAAEEVFLWTRTEAVGQNVSILMPDNIAAEHDHYIRKYLNTGIKTIMGTTRMLRGKRKDGTLFPAQLQLEEVLTDTSVSFVGVINDRQEYLEFERKAALSIALTEASTIPVVIMDRRGIILKFNKAAEQTFKCSADEVIGRKVNILMPRSEADVHDRYLERYLRTGQKKVLDGSRYVKAKRFNGEIFSALLSVLEMRQGGKWFFVGQLEDMTDRLHYEMIAAAGSVTKTAMPTPLIITNAEGKIVFASESACRAFGYSQGELYKRPVGILMDEPLTSHHAAVFKAYTRSGTNRRRFKQRTIIGPAKRREADGTFSTFQASIAIKDFSVPDGGDFVLAFIENITPKQSLEMYQRVGNTITDMSAVPLVLFTDSGVIQQMSRSAEVVFRTRAADMYGKSIDTLFATTSDESAASSPIRGVVQGGGGPSVNVGNTVSSPRSATSSPCPVYRSNPVQVALEEYRRSGLATSLGRSLRGVACTIGSSVLFDVEVRLAEVLQGDERLFLAYIRDATDDLRLLETNYWNEALMAVSTMPVFSTTLDGSIFGCSDSACKQYGWTREEMIGMNVSALMPLSYAKGHDVHLDNFRKRLDSAAKGKEMKKPSLLHREVILAGRTRTGVEFPVGIFVKDIHIPGSDPFLVAGLRDCTSEIALAVHESIGRSICFLSPAPFITISSAGIVKEFSPSAEAFFGYAAVEVVGRNVGMLMPEDVGRIHDGFLRSFEKTGISHLIGNPTTLTARGKNGLLFAMKLYVKDIRRAESLDFVAFMSNVTEKKALRKAQVVRGIVADLHGASIIECSVGGSILRCSQCAREELDYSEEDLVGMPIYDLLPQVILGIDKVTVAVRQEGWLSSALAELQSVQEKGNHRVASGSIAQRVSETLSFATDGALHVVRRQLSGQRKDGSILLYEVVMTLAATKLIGSTERPDAIATLAVSDEAEVQEQCVIVYMRNLSSDFDMQIQVQKKSVAIALCPSLFIVINEDGNISEFSATVEEAFGYTYDELIGNSLSTIFAPPYAAALMKYIERYRVTGVSTLTAGKSQIMQVRHKGGRLFNVELHVKDAKDGEGHPYFIANLRETSTEMEAVAEDGLSAALLKDAPIAIITTNHEGVVEEYTGAAERLLRFSQLEVLGKSIRFLKAHPLALEKNPSEPAVDEGDKNDDFFLENMNFSRKQQKSIQERLVITRGDGTVMKANVRIRSIASYRGKFPRFFAYIEEIDHSLAVQHKVRALTRLFSSSISAILVVTALGTVLRCNAAAEELLQYTEAEITGSLVRDLTFLNDNDHDDDDSTYEEADGGDNDGLSHANPARRMMSAIVEALHSVRDGEMGNSGSSAEHSVMSSSARWADVKDSFLMRVPGVPLIRKDGKMIVANATVIIVPPSSAGDEPQVALHLWNVTDGLVASKYRKRENELQETAHAAAVEVDLEGRFIECSPTFLSALGYTEAEMLGKPFGQFVPIGDTRLALFIARSLETVRQGQITSTEQHDILTFRDKRSAIIRMSGEFRCVVRPGGSLFSVVVVMRLPRPSERQMTQVALSAMALGNEGILLISHEGIIQHANAAAEKLFEVPARSSLLGVHVDTLAGAEAGKAVESGNRDGDDNSTSFLSQLHECAKAAPGSSGATVVRIGVPLSVDGSASSTNTFSMRVSARDVSDNALTVYDSADSLSSMLLVQIHAMTAEQQYSLNLRTMEVALDFSFHASLIISSSGMIGVFSSVAVELLGASTSAAIGKNITGFLFSEADGARLQQVIGQFLRTMEPQLIEAPRRMSAHHYSNSGAGSPSSATGGTYKPDGTINVEVTMRHLTLTSSSSECEFIMYLRKL